MHLGYVLKEKLTGIVDGQAVGNEEKRESRLLLGLSPEHTDTWGCHWSRKKLWERKGLGVGNSFI